MNGPVFFAYADLFFFFFEIGVEELNFFIEEFFLQKNFFYLELWKLLPCLFFLLNVINRFTTINKFKQLET